MPIISLGAECDLDTTNDRRASFSVSEFAVLDSGRRVTLHRERGFCVELSTGNNPWRYLSTKSLERDVRTTVLPDNDDTDDEHPWSWLAELLDAQGFEMSPDELRSLPYEVVFSKRLLARLPSTD